MYEMGFTCESKNHYQFVQSVKVIAQINEGVLKNTHNSSINKNTITLFHLKIVILTVVCKGKLIR